jgi:hypothetical protein
MFLHQQQSLLFIPFFNGYDPHTRILPVLSTIGSIDSAVTMDDTTGTTNTETENRV